MASILIKNGLLINENQQYLADIYVEDGFIAEMTKMESLARQIKSSMLMASGYYLES